MTAILGRLATYSGRELEWDDAINSNVTLAENLDQLENLESEAPIQPDEDGRYSVARPGVGAKEIIDWSIKKSRTIKKKPAKKEGEDSKELEKQKEMKEI